MKKITLSELHDIEHHRWPGFAEWVLRHSTVQHGMCLTDDEVFEELSRQLLRFSSCQNCQFHQSMHTLPLSMCAANGRNIEQNVRNGCPKNLFGVISVPPGPGDLIAAAAKIVGADKAAKVIARWLGKEDCGCAARAQKINRIWATLKKRIERNHNQ